MNKMISMRITREELEAIELASKILGYSSVSSFLKGLGMKAFKRIPLRIKDTIRRLEKQIERLEKEQGLTRQEFARQNPDLYRTLHALENKKKEYEKCIQRLFPKPIRNTDIINTILSSKVDNLAINPTSN